MAGGPSDTNDIENEVLFPYAPTFQANKAPN